jgi:hypothetical protein
VPATSIDTSTNPKPGAKRRRISELGSLSKTEYAPESDVETPDFNPNADEPSVEPEPALADDGAPELAETDDAGDEDPNTQSIFGMDPQALLASLRAGKIPTEMLDQVWAEVPYTDANGQTHTVRMTMNELRNSAMLRSQFTRGTQEMRKLQAQAKNTIAHYEQLEKNLTDPRFFRDWVEQNGKFDAFYAAATELAREIDEFNKMSPEQQDAYVQRRELEHERRRFATEREKHEADTRTARRAELQRQNRENLTRMVPIAFARLQIQDGKLSQRIFGEELMEVCNEIPQERWTGITQEIVDAAAQGTLERLREMARYKENDPTPAAGATPTPAPAARRQTAATLPTTALSGGPVPGAPPPSTARKRLRISEFGAAMQKRR